MLRTTWFKPVGKSIKGTTKVASTIPWQDIQCHQYSHSQIREELPKNASNYSRTHTCLDQWQDTCITECSLRLICSLQTGKVAIIAQPRAHGAVKMQVLSQSFPALYGSSSGRRRKAGRSLHDLNGDYRSEAHSIWLHTQPSKKSKPSAS